MKTELDAYPYQKWYLASFNYQDNLLILDVARLHIDGDQNEPPRYVVVFGDVRFFQVYDEVAHRDAAMFDRDEGVLAQHGDSRLIDYLRAETGVLDGPGEYKHFSLLTGGDFVHVVSRADPTITKAS
jgi:hypothetical protein